MAQLAAEFTFGRHVLLYLPSFCSMLALRSIVMQYNQKESDRLARGRGKLIDGCPQAIGKPVKKTPGTEDRPGTRREFQFPAYASLRFASTLFSTAGMRDAGGCCESDVRSIVHNSTITRALSRC
jgi:hypothetical protein